MTFEELAGRVPGVLALRTVTDDDGILVEVHVLAAPGRSSEDVARSIRSIALVSDVDLPAERVHVVQLDADEEVEVESAPATTDGPDADPARAPVDIDLVAPDPTVAPATVARPRLSTVDVRVIDGVGRATVELELGALTGRGTAEFVPTTPTERRAVAEATLRALTGLVRWNGAVAVDSAVVVPLATGDVALVTLAAVAGDEQTLVGAAGVQDGGVHDALARATLDATNRAVAQLPSTG